MKTGLLLTYLDCRRHPLAQVEGADALHREICRQNPQFYLKLLSDSVAHISHRREVLANVLEPQAASAIATSTIHQADIVSQLRKLSVSEALATLEVVRNRQINRRRARGVGLDFLLGHPQFAEIAATRRQRIVRLLRHLLGERTWSSVRRALSAGTPQSQKFLRRVVLRHVANQLSGREALRFLAAGDLGRTQRGWLASLFKSGDERELPSDQHLARSIAARRDLERGDGLPRDTLFGLRGTYHPEVPAKRVRSLAANPPALTGRDGVLTALFKRVLNEGERDGDARDLNRYLAEVTERLPAIEGSVAVILDLSASVASSGERAHHPAALGLTLTRTVEATVRGTATYQCGGDASLAECEFPRAAGETDLATALIEAASDRPNVVLIVTDGYENVREGDVAEVTEGLSRLGFAAPIYQIVPRFVASEDLTRRSLSDAITVLPIDGEDGVRELLARIVLLQLEEQHDDTVPPEALETLDRLLIAGN